MNDKDNTNGLQPKGTGTLTLQSIAKSERALTFRVKENNTQVWLHGDGVVLCLNNLAGNLGPTTGLALHKAIAKYIDEEIEGMPAQHPDDAAIDRFAAAMKEKMAKSREKGRSGWADTNVCTADALNEMLNEHIGKGDPMDVAILAMMLYMRGDQTKAPNNAAVAAIAYAIDKCESEDGMEFLGYWNEGEFDVLRRNWEDIPDAVFIGADPLFKPSKA